MRQSQLWRHHSSPGTTSWKTRRQQQHQKLWQRPPLLLLRPSPSPTRRPHQLRNQSPLRRLHPTIPIQKRLLCQRLSSPPTRHRDLPLQKQCRQKRSLLLLLLLPKSLLLERSRPRSQHRSRCWSRIQLQLYRGNPAQPCHLRPNRYRQLHPRLPPWPPKSPP